MLPPFFKFSTKPTPWGLQKRIQAIKQCIQHQSHTHSNLRMERCGLIIRCDLTQFGMLPDSLVQCDCCGKGCLEVKCPYILKATSW